MNQQPERVKETCDQLASIEERVRGRLIGRVRELKLLLRDNGLVLKGYTKTYYAKQLAQHVVLEITDLPLGANEIEVS